MCTTLPCPWAPVVLVGWMRRIGDTNGFLGCKFSLIQVVLSNPIGGDRRPQHATPWVRLPPFTSFQSGHRLLGELAAGYVVVLLAVQQGEILGERCHDLIHRVAPHRPRVFGEMQRSPKDQDSVPCLRRLAVFIHPCQFPKCFDSLYAVDASHLAEGPHEAKLSSFSLLVALRAPFELRQPLKSSDHNNALLRLGSRELEIRGGAGIPPLRHFGCRP
mmetsp:Transcript_6774/g.13448  ORF Transcript_6774/g.13448 Transcript_6774/m.13448 type:complete len:217 (-) Transcript_6774:384-1034(-)